VPFADSEVDDFDKVIAVNVRGVYLGLRAAIRQTIEQARGSAIVVTSSGLGSLAVRCGARTRPPNTRCWARSLRGLDHARQGIRINALCPGLVDTELIRLTETTVGGGDSGVGRNGPMRAVVPLRSTAA
jgi:NAD(P)-dependent dehydrogenase (short-subunit alcohol dehydrogenase family)